DTDGRGAQGEGGNGRRHRTDQASRTAIGGGGERARAGRNGPDRSPSGRQAVARTYRPGEGTRVVSRRRGICRRAASALRSRPAHGRRGDSRRNRIPQPQFGGEPVNSAPLCLGSSTSPIAIAHAGDVARLIPERTGRRVEIVGVTTFGDVSRENLTQIGG